MNPREEPSRAAEDLAPLYRRLQPVAPTLRFRIAARLTDWIWRLLVRR